MLAIFLLAAACSEPAFVHQGKNKKGLSPCDEARGDAYMETSVQQQLRQQLEAGAFYKSLISRFGTPAACFTSADSGALELRYRFSNEATLRTRFDPRIEYSDHVIELNRSLTWKEAEEYLRRDEQDQFGVAGCGIAWDQPAETTQLANGARRDRYRGDTCNCQAYVESTLQDIKLIGFRSTC